MSFFHNNPPLSKTTCQHVQAFYIYCTNKQEVGGSMNTENITIQDCIEMYMMKGYHTIIENGCVVGFRKEGINNLARG